MGDYLLGSFGSREKGGRPSKTNNFSENQIKTQKAKGFFEKQTKAKKADTDKDTETETDIEKEKDTPPPQRGRERVSTNSGKLIRRKRQSKPQ